MDLALLWLLLATVVVPCIAGCNSPASPSTTQPSLRTVQMQIGQKLFTLEVADTDASRERGLMFRDSMPPDQGMLFVFPDERRLDFWMRNTAIPLDIIFLDATGRVVSIHQMRPYNLRTTTSAAPAKYAIELNQGAASAAGVQPGDQLPLPPDAREPAKD